MAIVLSKLSLPTQELCDQLREYDFSDPRITVDKIELLMSVLPTYEETQKLLEYQNAPHLLRDIEQKVMPFCTLERSVPRLKLMEVFLSHEATYNILHQRCHVFSGAAEQVHVSGHMSMIPFRNMFPDVLFSQ